MKWLKIDRQYVIRLERGEEVQSTMTEFVRRQNIQGGTIQGLGAVKDVELGLYDPHEKVYHKRTFEDDMELGSLTGNISWFEGNPILHCHVTVAAADLQAYTGHLFSATVAVTVEMIITSFSVRLNRARDEEVGLNLLELE
jgi:predicted DNA-binding protein with PD1-like motif